MCYAPQGTCHTVGEAVDISTGDIFKTDHLTPKSGSRRQITSSAGESEQHVSLILWWAVPFQTLSPWGLEVRRQLTDKSLCFMSAVWTHYMHSFTCRSSTQACGSPHENTHTWVTLVASSPSIAPSTAKARSLHWHTISDTWPQSHIWLASQWSNDQPA